jgi:signal transduction histidine kinase/CheY-like chemotaxis protein
MRNSYTTATASTSLDSDVLQILIVEDSDPDTALVVETLQQAGLSFRHDVAATLPQCQTYLSQTTYDAVLADYRLPGFTAYQVMDLLHEHQPANTPLILITGFLGEEAAVECIKSGISDYVLKDNLLRLPIVLKRSLREAVLHRQQQDSIRQIHQQAQQQTIINQIVQAMRGTLVLADVLQTTVNALHDALDVSRCLVFRPGERQGMQACHVSEATTDRHSLLGIYCGFYQLLEQQLAAGEPIAISSFAEQVAPDLQAIAQHSQIKSLLIIPLRHQEIYLGGISLLQCDQERQWQPHEIELVQAIADHCAIAIHQAELFSHLQQQNYREQLLNRISRALNSSLDPEYILHEIVKLTGECFQVNRVVIYRFEDANIHVDYEWQCDEQLPAMMGLAIPVDHWFDQHPVPVTARTRQIFHFPDYAVLPRNPSRRRLLHEFQIRSCLGVPIFVRDRCFGGLDLYTTGKTRTFSPDEMQLLERIADQMAIALYNAQSYERLEQLVQIRTQELEKEKRLSDAANLAKSEFLAHMSHELRTPLTGILGFTSVLQKQVFGALNQKQEQYLEGIASCGQHLLDLINDLLDLSKIEAGREELFLEPVVVQEICDASLNLVRELANSRGLTTELDIAPRVNFCIADKRRLKQILVNLLSNAVKFTDTGTVQLKVEQDDKMTYFHVIDTGIGISVEDQGKLFQAFQQLDAGLSRKYQGTGLGLALAMKLAQLHDGDIQVQSQVGQGSQFTVRLPRQQDGVEGYGG